MNNVELVRRWRARKNALVDEMKAMNREAELRGRKMSAIDSAIWERLKSRARVLVRLIEAAEESGEA